MTELTNEPERDPFRVEGLCWCPPEMTLYQATLMGHTESCTTARRGWETNRRKLSSLAAKQQMAEQAGRALLERAEAAMQAEAAIQASPAEGGAFNV